MTQPVRVDLRAPGRVWVGGSAVALAPAQWRIMAALAIRRSGLPADELLEVSKAASVGSLRTLITGIRRQFEQHGVDGGTTLRFTDGRYRVDGVTTDLDEEAGAVERAALMVPRWPDVVAALRPVAGALTTTVVLTPLDDDDPVRTAHAERRRLDGLAMLAEGELREGSAEAAAALLDGIDLDVQGMDERLSMLAAVASYRRGQQREALRRLADARHALLEELGQSPSPAAQQLELAILRQDLGLAGWPDTEPAVQDKRPLPLPLSVRSERSLHGRERELAALDDVARSEGACLVLVVGPTGIGKSSLIAHWAAGRHSAGATVLWARAGEGENEYGVLSQLSGQLSEETRDGYRSALEAADALLASLRRVRDVVIVLDRVDEMSPGEAQALGFLLGGRGAHGRLTVLAETAGSPAPPFTELLVRESARGAARTLDVGPLDAAAVTRLVLARTGERDDHRLRVRARELFDTSGGNPLFVSLAVETGQHSPQAMTDLLDLTLGTVSPRTLEVLQLATVLGPTFHLTDLATVSGLPVAVLTDALADAARHNLLTEFEVGTYRVVHDALRRRIVARMGPTREAVLHQKVIDAHLHDRDDTTHLLHAVRALPVTGDRRSLEAAVHHSRALIDAGQYREALRLANAAAQGAEEWPSTTDSEMVSVLATQAAAVEHHGDREGAKTLHDRAWTLAQSTGHDTDLVAAARALGVAGESMIPNLEHHDRLATALSRCTDPADRSSLALRVAQLALNAGDVARARALLDDTGTATHLPTHTRLLLERHVLDESPELEKRLTLSSRAAEAAETAGDMEALAIAAAYRSTDLFTSGRLTEAFESWHDEDRIAIERPTPKERWFAAARRCFASQVAGDAAQSTADADAALNLGLELGYVDALPAYGVQLFCIRASHGALHDLVDALEEQAGTPGAPAAWQLGLACAVLEAGDVDRAGVLLEDGIARLTSTSSRFAATGWLLAGRILVELDQPPPTSMKEVFAALAPWTGTFGVVGTSVGYLGPVDTILEQLAVKLGDPRAVEFRTAAERLVGLFNTDSRT